MFIPAHCADFTGLNDRERSAEQPVEKHMQKVDKRRLKQWIRRLAVSTLNTLQYSGIRQKSRKYLHENQPLIEELEARQLYSVDNALAFVIQNDHWQDTVAEYNTLTPASSSATQIASQNQRSHELVFVDIQVEGYESIVSDLAAQQDKTRQLEVYFLDSQQDGLQQISRVLAPLNNVDAIHIISHGQAGEIQLGNQSLSTASITDYSDQLSAWSASLDTDADMLIYGCDVAGNITGQTLLQTISDLTKTDIAASTDLTGHASLNANWDLEYQTGKLESSIVVSKKIQAQFVGSLQIFTVDTTVDTTDSSDGVTSLREAILLANSTANLNSIPDEIHFDISGSTPSNHVIQLSSALPTIDDALIIDGATEPDDSATSSPIIEIRGDASNSEFNGFTINASGSGTTLKGVMISNTGNAIVLNNGGNNTIQGIHFGQTHSGSQGRNTGSGIVINNSSDNLIGGITSGDRNIISNNKSDGMEIIGANASGNRIEGNYIGTDASGNAKIGNRFNGIHISDGAHDNTIGGATPAAGNVVSGNGTGILAGFSGDGVEISGATTSNNNIQNNIIGLAADGNTLLGNARQGVWVEDAPDTQITDNAIAGNGSVGIGIAGTHATGTSIKNNTIHHNNFHGIGTGTDGEDFSSIGQPSGITIRTNTIFANAGDEINLSASLSTTPSPVLIRATLTGTNLQIAGSLPGSETYEIDYYVGTNPDAERYLGSATLTTDTSGNFVQAFTGTTVTAGEYIIATATDINGNTSEFSKNIQVSTTSTTDDSINTAMNSPGTINVISNDSDSSGKALVLLDVNKPDHGSVTVGQNGFLTYTPDTNFIGSDSFSYTVSNDIDSPSHYWGLSGNTQDALNTGNTVAQTNTNTIDGSYGQGLSFQNSVASSVLADKGYLTIPGNDVQYNNEMTLSLDFKLDDNTGSNYQYLFSHGDFGADNSINVYLGEDGNTTESEKNRLKISINDNESVLINIGSDGLNLIGDNSWHTLTVTVDSNSIKAFIDGDIEGMETASGNTINPVGDLIVGGRNDLDTSRFYNGDMDSLRIYSRALSNGEVAALAETPFSIQGQVNVTVSNGNIPPTLTTNTLNPTFNENDNFKSIFNSVSVDAIESGQTFTELVFTISNVADLTTGTPAERLMLDNTFVLLENGSGITNDNSFGYSINLNSTTATITVTKNNASATGIQNLIESIQYKNVSNNPTSGDRVFTITQLTDSGGTANGGNDTATLSVNSTVTIVAVNDPPEFVIIRSDKPVFYQGGPAVLLDENITVGDFELNPLNSGDGDFSGATLTLSRNGGVNSEDIFTIYGLTQAVIETPVTSQEFANFNNNTPGKLKINFDGSEAPTQYGVNAILRQIAYSNTNSSISGDIQLDYVLDDGNSGSQGSGGAKTATGSVTVNVAVNASPILEKNTLTLHQGDTITLNDTMLLASDSDSSPGNIIITPENVVQGYFASSTTPAIAVASFTQSAVSSGKIIFVHDGGELAPSYDLRLSDGFNNIGPVAATINFTAQPVATHLNQTIHYTEDDASVNLEDIVVSGVGASVNITATLTLTDPGYGELTTSGTASYASNVWTITDTVTNVNAALATVSFIPATDNDQNTTVTAQITGENGSHPITGVINLNATAVNDQPTITVDATKKLYLNNSGAIDIDPGLTISDIDSPDLSSAVVKFGKGYLEGEDVLQFTSQSGITGSFSANTGTLTLNGTASVADYETALRSVQYEDVNTAPTHGKLTIKFSVNDGSKNSQIDRRIIELIDDESPRASNDSGIVLEGGSTVIDLVDNDSPSDTAINITSITIVDDPVNGSLVVHQNGTVTYTHDGSNTDSDSFTYTVDDNDPTTSNIATVNITVTASNSPPTLTAHPLNPGYLENGPAVAVFNSVVIDAAESNQGIDELVFTISNVSQAGLEHIEIDNATFSLIDGTNGTTSSNGYGFSVSVAGSTATVTLTTNTATPTAMSSLVESIAYRNSSQDPTTADRAFTLTSIKDSGGILNGGVDSAALSINSIVSIIATNNIPTATNLTQTISYTEDEASVTLNPIEIDDIDSGDTVTAMLVLADPASGTLSTSGTATYNSSTGRWSITGTLVNVNAALATITFNPVTNSSQNTQITTHIEDAAGTGPINGLITLNGTPVNDTPVSTGITDITVNEDSPPTVIDLSSAFTDIEDGNNLTYSITGNDNPSLFNTVITDSTAQTITLNYADNSAGISNISVRATDSGSNFVETTFIVTVNPGNNIATEILLSNSVLLSGTDTSTDYAVGLLSTNDPDIGDIASFTLVGGVDAGLFSIAGINNNELIINAGVLDSDTNSTYDIIVESTDLAGESFTQSLVITVDSQSLLDQLITEPETVPTTPEQPTTSTTDPVNGPEVDEILPPEIQIELTDPNEPPGGGSHSAQPTETEQSPEPEITVTEETPSEEQAPLEQEDENFSATLPEINNNEYIGTSIQAAIEQDIDKDNRLEEISAVKRSGDFTTDETYSSALSLNTDVGKNDLSDLEKSVDIKMFIEQMDKLRETSDDQSQMEKRIIGSSTLVTGGLSIGYIMWLVRGGVLMSSVLSSLPAWRFIDPLPILGRAGDSDEDDESLESIIKQGSEKIKQADGQQNQTMDSEQ